MKLTTKSEYSLLALIYIARHQGESFVKIEDICSKYNITKKYLEQLLLILRQNRLIKTKRGPRGGYCLARAAEEISVAEIVRMMDGALAPTESVSKYFFTNTPISQEKKLVKVFKEIRNYISKTLEELTLSQLI